MTWRIRAIALYRAGDRKERREINFDLSRLQIITGVSARGKSSVLDIVSYCLLSGGCSIPKGTIRERVSDVGMVCENAVEKLAIVRALPMEGELSSGAVHLERGPNVWFPETPDPRWNLDTAKEALGDFTGIEAVPLLENSQSPAEPSAVNIRHCAPFLFQPQDVIASRNMTFPWLDDPFFRRHVLDALDYFLGLVTMQTMVLRAELRQLLAEQRRAQQAAEEARRLRAYGFERGLSLRNDALVLELVQEGSDPTSLEDILVALKSATAATPDSVATAGNQVPFDRIQGEEARLRATLRREELRLAELSRYMDGARQRGATAQRQLDRIRLHELFPDYGDTMQCPLCLSGTLSAKEIEAQFTFASEALSAVADRPHRVESRVENEREKVVERVTDLRARLNTVQDQLMKLLPLQRPALLTEEAIRKRLLQGRISEYIRAMSRVEPVVDTDAAKREARIKELTAQISETAIERQRQMLQERLTDIIAEVVKKLDVEFKDDPVRLDLKKLIIEVKVRGQRWVPLSEIGSAANWLSYHLAVAIGLHRLFRQQESSVPPVLLIDQPSQVWFPSDRGPREGVIAEDKDLEAVRRVYRLLHDCATKDGFPQIIVVDHADLSEPWFRESIREDWHDEEHALVPPSWLAD